MADLSNAIRNESGQVAIRYVKGIPKYIRLPNGHDYAFSVSRNISVTFVPEEDVDAVLNIREGCCGSVPKTGAYVLIDQLHYNRWTGVAEW